MKRTELYAKVWAEPMSHLAKELGISDMGLAQACRQHAVPAPPRGYWSKLRAGQTPHQAPLPKPELDTVVQFTSGAPRVLDRRKAASQKRSEAPVTAGGVAIQDAAIVFSEAMDDAHPLVKATRKYVERIPVLIKRYERRGVHAWTPTKDEDLPPLENHGRYSLLSRGLLDITASLDIMEWVLQFHASIFRGLKAGGMEIARREELKGRAVIRSEWPAIEARCKGEQFAIKFSQGYKRTYLDPEELAKKRKESSWARDFEHRPSDKLTFSFSGTEYRASATWQGTQEKLEAQVDDIVRSALALVPQQIEIRKERETNEALTRQREAARALEQRRSEARSEQVKQAFLMMEADERVRRLKEFLVQLEQRASEFNSPYDSRVKVWIDVVALELSRNDPVQAILQRCLSTPAWGGWPPDWWPQGLDGLLAEKGV
ncbi:hypothetical protein [Variovorax sp. RCC_210]|uniref:hypothetical protein n=1 Tax=Variovorax sp. RCC_210 TaxID=3239217 RepID=UPI003525199C